MVLRPGPVVSGPSAARRSALFLPPAVLVLNVCFGASITRRFGPVGFLLQGIKQSSLSGTKTSLKVERGSQCVCWAAVIKYES